MRSYLFFTRKMPDATDDEEDIAVLNQVITKMETLGISKLDLDEEEQVSPVWVLMHKLSGIISWDFEKGMYFFIAGIFAVIVGGIVFENTDRCPQCGEELPGGAVFCNKCGFNMKIGKTNQSIWNKIPAFWLMPASVIGNILMFVIVILLLLIVAVVLAIFEKVVLSMAASILSLTVLILFMVRIQKIEIILSAVYWIIPVGLFIAVCAGVQKLRLMHMDVSEENRE